MKVVRYNNIDDWAEWIIQIVKLLIIKGQG